jgi:hypothetical protein
MRSSFRTESVHRIPHSTFVTTRNAPPDECRTAVALLLFLPNEKAKYFSPEGWTRRANQVDAHLPAASRADV